MSRTLVCRFESFEETRYFYLPPKRWYLLSDLVLTAGDIFSKFSTGDVSPRSASIHFVTLGHHPPSPLKRSVQSYPAFRRNILPLSSREDCTNVRTQKATIWLDASTSHFFRTWMFSAPEGRYVKHKHAVENLEEQLQLKNEIFVWNNLRVRDRRSSKATTNAVELSCTSNDGYQKL